MMKRQKHTNFAVLGLGRFGMSIVRTLAEYDVNILACDLDESMLSEAAEYATHVVRADVSDEKAMEKLGIGNFDVVILAMAEDFEASLIATMLAKELGARRVIVKAMGLRQKKVLLSLGADEVILPEREMGIKLARKLAGPNILDILEESEHYTISEMQPLAEWIGKSLKQADVRRRHHLTILALRRGEKMMIPVSPDCVLEEQDVLIALSEHKTHAKK